jgi:hypothetical protein
MEGMGMAVLTFQVSDELAARIEPLHGWLSMVLELGLIGFRTPAVETATEVIEFLSGKPTPQVVLNYFVSQRAQTRLQRLLSLNSAGLLGEAEQRELDELQRIEQIVTMLKIQVAKQLSQNN